MTKAVITTEKNGYSFLEFFNSKEVYNVRGFETKRRALNYAKKCGITVFEKLPEGVIEYSHYNN